MKELYRKETGKDVYAEDCCEHQTASYSDEYVRWLEAKIRQQTEIIKSKDVLLNEVWKLQETGLKFKK